MPLIAISKRQLGFGVMLVGLLLFHAEYADGILVVFQLVFMGLLGLLALGAYFVFSTKAVPVARWIGTFLLASTASILLDVFVSQWQDTRTENRLSQLITTLETYHRQQGWYPDSLAQLVPRYLPSRPTTAYGLLHPRPIEYQPHLESANVMSSYYLSYYVGVMVDAHYSSKDGSWVYDD
ncbi:hypothetical protein GCM10027048_43130 [Hymenobacter coalescens]